jgi:cob(I)alamin adenosyltransferase
MSDLPSAPIASSIDSDNINTRHQRRMERKKALMDEKIQQAQRTTGVLLIHTGNGKGKSSSAFGMVMRALGHGMKVGVVQFIKGAMSTGEEIFLRRFPDEVEFYAMGEGYTWETQNRDRDIEKATVAWAQAKKFLDLDTVIADLDARPEMQHVVVTGRGALPELIAIADTVTEMNVVKHAFKDGIVAQAGVEW